MMAEPPPLVGLASFDTVVNARIGMPVHKLRSRRMTLRASRPRKRRCANGVRLMGGYSFPGDACVRVHGPSNRLRDVSDLVLRNVPRAPGLSPKVDSRKDPHPSLGRRVGIEGGDPPCSDRPTSGSRLSDVGLRTRAAPAGPRGCTVRKSTPTSEEARELGCYGPIEVRSPDHIT
jgi:hypothetical protein